MHGQSTVSLSSKKRTFINVVKSYCGAGILAIPFAMSQGGLVTGIILYIFISIVSVHCMLLLVKAKHHVVSNTSEDADKVVNFEDIGQFTFGTKGRLLVDICLLSSQVGFCVVYTIFLGENMYSIYPGITKLAWMFIAVPVLILLCWIRHLKWLAPFSLFAILIFLFGFTVALFFSIDQPNFAKLDVQLWPTSLFGFISLTSLVIYGFEGIGLVLPVENASEDKKAFPWLFIGALAFVTCVYVAVGAVGYIGWGSTTLPILMQNIESKSPLVLIARIGFVCAALCTYPLMMWPVIDRLEEILIFRRYRAQQTKMEPINTETTPLVLPSPSTDSSRSLFSSSSSSSSSKRCDCALEWKRNALRAGLVLLALGLGVGIPAYDLFTQLIGSLFSTTLSFSVPILIHLKLFSWQRRKSVSGMLLVVKDASILLLGVSATVRIERRMNFPPASPVGSVLMEM